MQVAQRGTSFTGSDKVVVTNLLQTGLSYNAKFRNVWTVDQSTDAPDGFSNSFKVDCTTAARISCVKMFLFLINVIEAQNLQHLKFGTIGAKSITLVFM